MTMTVQRAARAALAGCSVVISVDRRSTELAAALERHGAVVQHAPALAIVPHIDDDRLIQVTRSLIANPPEIVVVSTGVGFRGWLEAVDEAGLLDELQAALSGARFIARGAKGNGAIQQAGFETEWTSAAESSAELGRYLLAESLAGRRIAVQHHGSGSDGLDELFAAAGADVVSLTVYRWGPPEDPEAVARSIEDSARGEVDAVLFTGASGAAEWLAAAERAGRLADVIAAADARRVLFATVGPVTAAPMVQAGIRPLIAERSRLGSLVRGVVNHFGSGGAAALGTRVGVLELRSLGAILDGAFIPLAPTGLAVLRELFEARGAVVTRERLLEVLPRSGNNGHAVETAIARVRESIGVPDLVRTVVRRGYRIDV